jgi:DMSO reductase anchor subunit
METLREYLPLILPLLLIQLVLMIAALLDLRRREKTRGPKWLWALVILFGELLGPIVYFAVARVDE